MPSDIKWQRYNASQLKGAPVKLTTELRRSVETAVRETCLKRKWDLYALNARSNHVHSVVAIGPIKPERVLTAFKANATRQLREDLLWREQYSPWAEKGSKRRLWNERSVIRAIEYVLYGQDDEFPTFED